ncbi:hypothetical protein [Brevibacillus choshinensis]|uniref:COG4705 family protein n=1 Tax=Brevibacillus choshinensis TaxID=54911 RepID=UPI002E23B962|nr:hypothetical protein [Brevibacillus choshinensis]
MELIKTNEGKSMISKVPEVTIFFWIIKVLCTTVGETASDFLNVNLGFGLTWTSIVMGAVLLVVIFFQFKAKKFIPGIYWLTVVLISIFGTLVTDNMTDSMGIPLEVSTIGFCIVLALTFAIWYASEKTLSIHSIFTVRREIFYWLAILFTFALGTAAGDLMAESLGLGYLVTGVIVCAVIASVSVAWKCKLDPVLAFWIVYIMTRPLGASLGDYLSQPQKHGGLGLGAPVTSVIFIIAIILTVVFLSVTKRDLIPITATNTTTNTKPFTVFRQVAVVVCVLALASVTGYYWRHTKLLDEANTAVSQASQQGNTSSSQASSYGGTSTSVSQKSPQGGSSTSAVPVSPLGDLSSFIKIEEDTLSLVNAGNLSAANARVDDLEYAWDEAEARLKPMNQTKWTEIDDTIDNVLRELRAVHQDAAACKASLEASLAELK